jgi:hypothetical protein
MGVFHSARRVPPGLTKRHPQADHSEDKSAGFHHPTIHGRNLDIS